MLPTYTVHTDHWPFGDSEAYEHANELAIELITFCGGYDPDDLDDKGEPVSDRLQTQLLDVLFRSARLQDSLYYLVKTAEDVRNRPSVPMDAFNLTPGATFVFKDEDGRTIEVWTVMEFRDMIEVSEKLERVQVLCRRTDLAGVDDVVKTFDMHYCDKVNLIGHVRNPGDFDDNNWGNS